MKKRFIIGLRVLICCLTILVLTVAGYLCYVICSYSRIADGLSLTADGAAEFDCVTTGTEYTVVTQNMGFGAYTPEFTFFMDGGTESRAESAESVQTCIRLGAETVSAQNPDFVFLQEVDTDSTRSYHLDERDLIAPYFENHVSIFAKNYHSAYLFYPLTEPHGQSNSGMLTYSRATVSDAVRRSLPISTGFSKFLDLDRCYSVTRVPAENGRMLVLFNVHLSAYGADDTIHSAQMNMLFSEMQEEYEKGNYCVCGGDFNHDFTGNSTQTLNGGESVSFGWAQPFPDELFANYPGLYRADGYTGGTVAPTCRNCDIPYRSGNFTIIVDGFLVSRNVEITYLENLQTDFAYSDHNPVVMRFRLNEEAQISQTTQQQNLLRMQYPQTCIPTAALPYQINLIQIQLHQGMSLCKALLVTIRRPYMHGAPD